MDFDWLTVCIIHLNVRQVSFWFGLSHSPRDVFYFKKPRYIYSYCYCPWSRTGLQNLLHWGGSLD